MAPRPDVIYALIDPSTDEVRYIGKTNRLLATRLSAHLGEISNCHRCHWIQSLVKAGLKPSILAIETCGRWSWQDTEKFWIRSFQLAGARLTNNTSGGDGVCDLPKETRERMRLAWLGRKHTPEALAKMKNRRPGFTHSELTKRRMSIAQKGRKITWKEKIAESNRKLTAEQVSLIQGRLKSGEKVCQISKDLGIHRTTISKVKMGTYFLPYRR